MHSVAKAEGWQVSLPCVGLIFCGQAERGAPISKFGAITYPLMLFNPNWALHAAVELGIDPEYELWPHQFGSWLSRRVLLDLAERS